MARNLLKQSYHPSLQVNTPGQRSWCSSNRSWRSTAANNWKTISAFFIEEQKQAVGPLEVCAGFSGGAEAATHAINNIFQEEDTDGVLLADRRKKRFQPDEPISGHA